MEDVTTRNLHRDYAAINEGLTALFDSLGVRRTFTVPYVEGQQMSEHIASVGKAAQQAGGLTRSLMTTSHHSKGKGWGSEDGATVGHQSESLIQTTIPRTFEPAEKVIKAIQKFINDVAFFVGDDDKEVKTAQSLLNLVKKTNGSGMNLMHFGVLAQQLVAPLIQEVSRAHHATKKGAHVGNQLQPPRAEAASQPQAPQPQVPPAQQPQTPQPAVQQ